LESNKSGIAPGLSLPGLVLAMVGIILVIAGLAFLPQMGVLADAGGFPTYTPTVTSTWTLLPTFTETAPIVATIAQPTQKPPEETVIFSTPKALPTGTILSDADLVATLQGSSGNQAAGGSAGRLPYWIYAIMVFLAMALTGLIIFAVLRWLRHSP
jgi:hypothetical protein